MTSGGAVSADLLPPTWDPPADPAALAAVAAQLAEAGVDAESDHPIGGMTTLGVGGSARLWVQTRDDTVLSTVLGILAAYAEAEVPMLVLGRGSNLLVGDRGWPGLVIQLGASFKWQRRTGAQVSAGAGLAMPALAAWTAAEGLSGLEFAAGIPASVGGSVRMNAGAHSGATGDRLLDVEVASPDVPRGRRVPAEELQLGYRRSTLAPRAVVTAARWELEPADPADIRRSLEELRRWRRATQPLRQRNCGSVFTNPAGDSAGRLVDAAGGKSLRRGGAQVSDKHANFIVVDPQTRACDVRALIAAVRALVVESGGPLLEPEVRLVGAFSPVDAS